MILDGRRQCSEMGTIFRFRWKSFVTFLCQTYFGRSASEGFVYSQRYEAVRREPKVLKVRDDARGSS